MYLERPAVTKRCLDFVDGAQGTWLANVHATGGIGKTATLQWLISRQCVPAPRRIPVARIDFQHTPSQTVTTNQLELLLELARQLDEQIRGTPFDSFRRQLQDQTGQGGK